MKIILWGIVIVGTLALIFLLKNKPKPKLKKVEMDLTPLKDVSPEDALWANDLRVKPNSSRNDKTVVDVNPGVTQLKKLP